MVKETLSSYQQDGEREYEADSEAVVVDWELPPLHGVMLEAHWLVLSVLAQLFVSEEDHAHSDLFQPNQSTDHPRGTHRAKRREPGDRQQSERVQVFSTHELYRSFKESENGDVACLIYFKGWTTAK